MDKFLFTDGQTGVKEAQTMEELEELIASSQPASRVRIWIFNSQEWISYDSYRKKFPETKPQRIPIQVHSPGGRFPNPAPGKTGRLKKMLYVICASASIFLVFNFTSIKWRAAPLLNTSASRPVNVPNMDIDSLIAEIEYERDQLLDRSTRTNLRLRNTWPDRILLHLASEKEISSSGARFFNMKISVDNTTGFLIDQAVVRLFVWNNNKARVMDTFRFSPVPFDKMAIRLLAGRIKGDSISVDFASLRAKAFNFCYSSSVKNVPGTFNDRWFCRE